MGVPRKNLGRGVDGTGEVGRRLQSPVSRRPRALRGWTGRVTPGAGGRESEAPPLGARRGGEAPERAGRAAKGGGNWEGVEAPFRTFLTNQNIC